MRKPYSIRTPAFDATSGGIRVMWGLYGWLLAKGEIALINAQIQGTEFIGVYPEIYHGNDLGATKVARWILQTPGVMATHGFPSPTTNEYKNNPIYKDDEFFVFSKVYDTFGVDRNHELFLPILNMAVFKDKGKKRTKTCFLVGKGVNQFKHPKDSIELTRQFAQDQEALSDLLNECHTFYCYDRLSAMMDIARLCGVSVRYWGELPLMELMKYEPGLCGVGFKEEERQLHYKTFRHGYERLITKFSEQLETFIEITQS